MSKSAKLVLLESVFSLTIIQVANFIVPLMAIPLLTRVLGPSGWGEISFTIFVMQLLLVFTDYGFSLSAVRSIARFQNDLQKVSNIFSACWTIQWLILAPIILFAVIISSLGVIEFTHIVGLSLVVGNVLFPIWLLQGIEQLRVPAIIQLFARIVMLGLIFYFVQGPEDTIWALLFLTAHNILAGPILLWWIKTHTRIHYHVPCKSDLVDNFRSGLGIFFSKLSIGAYTSLIPISLGLLSGSEAVGFYYIADKIRVAASYVLTPLSLALFPRASNTFAQERAAGYRMVISFGSIFFILSLAFSAILFFFAAELVHISSGPDYTIAVPLLRIVAITPVLVCLSNIIGVQILLPLGQTRIFNISIHIGGVLAIVALGPAIVLYGAEGAAAVSVFAELSVSISMGIFLLAHIRRARVFND